MRVRKRSLPSGWYPGSASQAEESIRRMARSIPLPGRGGCAGIAPHAGWEFSGSLALRVLSCIATGMDTIVIIGGHLASTDGIMLYGAEAFDTPLGLLESDTELAQSLREATGATETDDADNTVEIQLPLLKFAAPKERVVGMRAPPSSRAEHLGECIADSAARLGRKVGVLGSTDLTHYGPGYGFTPAGGEAVAWVRDVNDRRFIDAALAMDIPSVLERSRRERSACSAGGAVAAISFARAHGVSGGTLLDYRTSYEIHPSESFVGYAAILFS